MKLKNKADPITILLVEDNSTDVMLIDEAFESAKIKNTLYVTKDGVDALDFLNKREKYTDMPRPDLILLDLNMPRKSGLEVLADLKVDKRLRRIPIIVLTTSKDNEDVVKAYGNCANCYINKPVDFDHFVAVVKSIQDFWFTVVLLPDSED